MTDLFVVWTPASIITALVGGLLLGFVLVSRFDNPRFDAIESVGVMTIIGIFAGCVFFLGQAVETYYSNGTEFAWRVLSRFGLWGLFVFSMAFGTGLGIRFRRGTWTT